MHAVRHSPLTWQAESERTPARVPPEPRYSPPTWLNNMVKGGARPGTEIPARSAQLADLEVRLGGDSGGRIRHEIDSILLQMVCMGTGAAQSRARRGAARWVALHTVVMRRAKGAANARQRQRIERRVAWGDEGGGDKPTMRGTQAALQHERATCGLGISLRAGV